MGGHAVGVGSTRLQMMRRSRISDKLALAEQTSDGGSSV